MVSGKKGDVSIGEEGSLVAWVPQRETEVVSSFCEYVGGGGLEEGSRY